MTASRARDNGDKRRVLSPRFSLFCVVGSIIAERSAEVKGFVTVVPCAHGAEIVVLSLSSIFQRCSHTNVARAQGTTVTGQLRLTTSTAWNERRAKMLKNVVTNSIAACGETKPAGARHSRVSAFDRPPTHDATERDRRHQRAALEAIRTTTTMELRERAP
jgi:hypothetical protein